MDKQYGDIDIIEVIVKNSGVSDFNGWLRDTLKELQVLDKVMLKAVTLTLEN